MDGKLPKYQWLNEYWLCPDSQRREWDAWANSGHPCKFSAGGIVGDVHCKFVKDRQNTLKNDDMATGE